MGAVPARSVEQHPSATDTDLVFLQLSWNASILCWHFMRTVRAHDEPGWTERTLAGAKHTVKEPHSHLFSPHELWTNQWRW